MALLTCDGSGNITLEDIIKETNIKLNIDGSNRMVSSYTPSDPKDVVTVDYIKAQAKGLAELHDIAKTYKQGDIVTEAGKAYIAKGAITAKAFDPTEWDEIGANLSSVIHKPASSATQAPDMRKNNLFVYTLTDDLALGKPTSDMGNRGSIVFIQDGTGKHKVNLDPAYTLGKNVLGLVPPSATLMNILEIDLDPNSVSLVDYIVYDTDKIFLNFIGEV